MNIQGKWALVTGASRGVGRRVATALAGHGCNLILHSRSLEGTAESAGLCRAAGVSVESMAAELSDPSQLQGLIKQVSSFLSGPLDILYNNAAISTGSREIYTLPIEDYQLNFLVNTIVPIKLCDAFLPGMLEQNWGRVVNVSSGIADQPNLMAYSCSKAAIDRYVRDMIPTLKGTNVLMNLMDPGWLRTDMGGAQAPNDPDDVIPGALIPVLLEEGEHSGGMYSAMDYLEK